MADVVFNPESNDLDDLFGKGERAYVLQDYETAVLAFSKAAELLAKQHNDDLHDSLGDIYLYYGKSLLQLSRKQGGPFTDGVLKEIPESDDEDDEAESVEGKGEATTNQETKVEPGKKGDPVNDDEGDNITTTKENETENEEDNIDNKGENNDNKDENIESSESTEDTNVDGKTEEEKEDELTDLQVAWEVLELAKTIFTRRGNDGRKDLADTLIVLGEISLESNMFSEGIEDMKKGLEIQKSMYGNDSRIVAETFYKIGMALGPNEVDEAVKNFTACVEYLKNRLNNLDSDDATKKDNQDEIDEIKSLLPEVEEKISDVQNYKEEMVKEITDAFKGRDSKDSSNPSSASSSSSATVNDISHLVKRKRKVEEDGETSAETPTKKVSI